ncbi:hypothetical protein J6590_026543 [Homalodisca vitripennis]|nr:hypothetical protein J6590_026543 [Homalodisca vitripennis]
MFNIALMDLKSRWSSLYSALTSVGFGQLFTWRFEIFQQFSCINNVSTQCEPVNLDDSHQYMIDVLINIFNSHFMKSVFQTGKCWKFSSNHVIVMLWQVTPVYMS